MTTLQVFDRPMCCSTGVCGPSVDPVLPRFAADLDWLKGQGVTVERYNLAQEPAPFTGHDDVKMILQRENIACLPLFRVNGEIVFKGRYPARSMMARWCGIGETIALPAGRTPCCGSTGCC
jgi:Arsenical resistance operon protein ArsD